jgi:hypothetical protein
MAGSRGGSLIQLQATIPDGVNFEDLRLSRDVRDGAVLFNPQPIEAICAASGFDIEELVAGPDPIVCALITAWYEEHLRRGGAPDPVQEDLMEETRLEQERGGGFSYAPGHA